MVKRTSEVESTVRDLESNLGAGHETGCNIANDQSTRHDVSCVDTPAVKRLKRLGMTSGAQICGRIETDSPPAVTPASSQCSCDASIDASAASTALSARPMTCPKAIAALLQNEANYCCTESKSVSKRLDYISWDDYFMAVARLSAHRSKDPYHPTGACIVDPSNRIIGTGYNGFPAGCSDDILPWILPSNTSDAASTDVTPWLHTPTPYMVHAEVNAILNKCSHDCNGARIYTQHFPCNECAKVIIQSRIAEVVYIHSGCDHTTTTNTCRCLSINVDEHSVRASRIMLTMAGVRMRQYTPKCHRLDLNFYDALDDTERNLAREKPTTNGPEASYEPAKCWPTSDKEFNDVNLLWKETKYDAARIASSKRNDYLSWDDYFMSMAFLTAQRSKDPNTQVGACIVDKNQRIVGLGYNGFPVGCSDDCVPWAREATSELHKKYLYVCHAEVNAILNKGSADVREGTLYVALFPCHDCSKVIIQAGIREVVYMSDRYHNTDSCRASRILLHMAGVRLRNYIPSVESIVIELNQVR